MRRKPSSTRKAAFHARLAKGKLPLTGRLNEGGRLKTASNGWKHRQVKVSRGKPAPAYHMDPRKRAFAVSRPTPKKTSVRERLRAALRATKAKVVG